ncbi:MAG: extracellular solute-binding protein [Clostridia bacterium]|nr:extracellular solute-binding protein [Clostridia bacterium]
MRTRIVTLVILLCCMFTFAVAEDVQAAQTVDTLYTAAARAYTLPVYAGEAVTTEMSLSLPLNTKGEATFAVPEDGQYEIWLSYVNTANTTLPTEMTVAIDGEIRFAEMQRVKLHSTWVDDGVFPTDRYGNEIATTPYAAQGVNEAGISDSTGRSADPMLFELTAGEHTIAFSVQDGGVDISALTLKAPVMVPAYVGGDASGDSIIVIEAEQIAERSESSIRGAGEFNAALSPYNNDHRMINFLDGASFDAAGDTVTWKFTVEESGWYQLGAYYRQSARADFPTFVDVYVDGVIPSTEAQTVAFDYTTSFTHMVARTGAGENMTLYLEAGDHTLSFRINAECMTPVYETIDVLLEEINVLSNDIKSLMGGATADPYRDYNMLENFPDLVDRLNGWAQKCEDQVTYIKQFSPIGSGSAFSSLTLCADQLRRLADDPEDLPRRMSEFSTGANSAARMLAQQLTDMAINDLSIDQIYLYQTEAKLPAKANFIQSTAAGIQRFFTSFTNTDYTAGNGEEGHLQVWMGRSRQYVETVQNMIDTQFTPATGIEVDISLMPDANKLVLANAAGTAPDVVLSLQYVVPSYLNIRGALYDLTQFEDFPEVAQRFSSGLFIPYILGDGVYAMPETVNFWVMFYRKDILESLQIEVPNSMDEVKLILPELQRRSMNFYFPTAGMVGTKVFPGTLPLILQAGGSIYPETIGDTTLDSEISLEGFREMTELFTIYNMPTDVPSPGFYQQFRDGTLPIGIADLATYNLLLNAAPELDGLWDIALFPGLTNDEGEVLRWTTGGAETMAIMSAAADHGMEDEAWEFLKWWSSAEVQSSFGNLLQSTYGSEYIWPTANQEAFATLPLRSAHKQVIIEQMEWMTEAPWVLGTYMLERELSNAFISVTADGVEARRAMDTAVKRINRETYRKLEEFGYYKDGVMLEEFPTPSVEVITNLIEEYNAKKAVEAAAEEGTAE